MCLTCVNYKAVNLAHSSPFSWLFFMFYFFSISISFFIWLYMLVYIYNRIIVTTRKGETRTTLQHLQNKVHAIRNTALPAAFIIMQFFILDHNTDIIRLLKTFHQIGKTDLLKADQPFFPTIIIQIRNRIDYHLISLQFRFLHRSKPDGSTRLNLIYQFDGTLKQGG